jgi:uncharacterized phage protein (TIGR01671 family)
MRPIEFRGLRTDGQGWVYGLLNQYTGKMYITREIIEHPTHADPAATWIYNEHEVLPETVRQFTGLTDKNGVKIFEGDKVMNEEGEILIISYQLNGFTMLTSYGQRLKGILGDSMDWFFKVEVIGNIHETQEGGNNG